MCFRSLAKCFSSCMIYYCDLLMQFHKNMVTRNLNKNTIQGSHKSYMRLADKFFAGFLHNCSKKKKKSYHFPKQKSLKKILSHISHSLHFDNNMFFVVFPHDLSYKLLCKHETLSPPMPSFCLCLPPSICLISR